MIEIRTFGTLMVRDPVADVHLASLLSRPKRAALLAYLASARPHGHRRRDELLALFWPELPQQNARKALNQSVYVLRSIIGQAAVARRGGEELGVDRTLVSCDAVAFEDALSRGDRGAALELYGGEFLAAFHMPGSRGFERWLDAEREHYRRRAIDAAIGQAAAAEGAGNGARRIRWLRRALEWSPYDEALLERLVHALADHGDNSGAAYELERFAVRLRRDLGLQISPQTRALLPRSLKGTAPRPTESPSPKVAAVGQADGPTVDTADKPPVQTADPQTVDEQTAGELAAAEPTLRASRRRRLFRWATSIALAGGLLGITLFTGLRSEVSAGVADSAPRRVLVTPLENRTGSEALDPLGRIAADWIARGLLRTGLVEVVPLASTSEADSARTSAHGAAAHFAFSGSFHRDNGQLVIEARIVGADRGAILRSLPPILAPEDDPLTGLHQLRQRTTGALATLVDPRFEDWADDASQPPDFHTYLVYVDAMERFERGDRRAAGDLFLDAASARLHLHLGPRVGYAGLLYGRRAAGLGGRRAGAQTGGTGAVGSGDAGLPPRGCSRRPPRSPRSDAARGTTLAHRSMANRAGRACTARQSAARNVAVAGWDRARPRDGDPGLGLLDHTWNRTAQSREVRGGARAREAVASALARRGKPLRAGRPRGTRSG